MPSHMHPHTRAQTGTASNSEQRALTGEQYQLEKALKQSREDVGLQWTKRNKIARSLVQGAHGANYDLIEIDKDGNCMYKAVVLFTDSEHTWSTLKQVHHSVTVSMFKCAVLPMHIR